MRKKIEKTGSRFIGKTLQDKLDKKIVVSTISEALELFQRV